MSILVDAPVGPEEKVFGIFRRIGIDFKNHQHTPLFSAKDVDPIEAALPGAHTKNLFLRSKVGFILVTLLGKDRLNLKQFQKDLGLGSLSFAGEEQLLATLQVPPGSVTPLALLHPSARDVKVYLDRKMMAYEILNFHPLRNDMTTSISSMDFRRYLESLGHCPNIVDLPKLPSAESPE